MMVLTKEEAKKIQERQMQVPELQGHQRVCRGHRGLPCLQLMALFRGGGKTAVQGQDEFHRAIFRREDARG